jgi:FkbM family methyltransferase
MSCIFSNDNSVEIKLIDHPFSQLFELRIYHEAIFRMIHTYLINNNIIDKTKNIIDLGAWIGDNSIPWAKNIEGIVYAIDPCKENCDFINAMKHYNSIENLTIIKAVISDSERIISIDTNDLHHCSFTNNDSLQNKLQAFSLDTLYQNNIINNIGYIHLDVEGMEHLVIVGANKLINTERPIISFEQHLNTDDYQSICKYFNTINYSVYLINEQLLGCLEDCRNFLAFPNTINIEDIEQFINMPQIFTQM